MTFRKFDSYTKGFQSRLDGNKISLAHLLNLPLREYAVLKGRFMEGFMDAANIERREYAPQRVRY